MIYRKLGSKDLNVSVIGFGCWQLGGKLTIAGQPQSYGGINEDEAKKAILLALESGINFFDTADWYGLGKSEYFLGKELNEVRHKVIIASKVGYVPDGRYGNMTDASYHHIMASCDRSLKRLGTDYINVYLLHFVPEENEMNGAIKALKELKESGKIREYGISIAHRFNELPRLIEHFPIIEGYYNLLLRNIEEYAPLLKRYNTGFISASPLSRGLLSGKDYDKITFDKTDIRKEWKKGRSQYGWYIGQRKKLEKYKELSRAWNISLKNLSLLYLLSNNFVSTIIPGMKSSEQVTELVETLNYFPLNTGKLNQLKECFSIE